MAQLARAAAGELARGAAGESTVRPADRPRKLAGCHRADLGRNRLRRIRYVDRRRTRIGSGAAAVYQSRRIGGCPTRLRSLERRDAGHARAGRRTARVSRYPRPTLQHRRGTRQGFVEQARGAADHPLVARPARRRDRLGCRRGLRRRLGGMGALELSRSGLRRRSPPGTAGAFSRQSRTVRRGRQLTDYRGSRSGGARRITRSASGLYRRQQRQLG